jgi:NAD(P)-dependent dehydrogenase (short-subunit alcohol dehydrogenase family)
MGLLDGRVVIVTGGGRGLGRSHCLTLASEGATVVVNDLGVDVRGDAEGSSPADHVVAEIEAAGGSASTNGASVTDFAAMGDLVADTVERYGALHAVVNNAGFLRDRMLTSMTEDDFDAVIDVHLKGTWTLTRQACGYWREQAKAGNLIPGRIVNTTSGSGLWGNVGQANYGAAKAGIAMLTRIVALEMERYSVTANCISPIAATRMLGTIGRDADIGTGWDPMDPANASPVVAWLCAEEAGWLTGAILRVDGNSVAPVEGYRLGDGYRAKTGETLTVEELGTALRRVFGVAPRGLGG